MDAPEEIPRPIEIREKQKADFEVWANGQEDVVRYDKDRFFLVHQHRKDSCSREYFAPDVLPNQDPRMPFTPVNHLNFRKTDEDLWTPDNLAIAGESNYRVGVFGERQFRSNDNWGLEFFEPIHGGGYKPKVSFWLNYLTQGMVNGNYGENGKLMRLESWFTFPGSEFPFKGLDVQLVDMKIGSEISTETNGFQVVLTFDGEKYVLKRSRGEKLFDEITIPGSQNRERVIDKVANYELRQDPVSAPTKADSWAHKSYKEILGVDWIRHLGDNLSYT